jgi:hypothetical protein
LFEKYLNYFPLFSVLFGSHSGRYGLPFDGTAGIEESELQPKLKKIGAPHRVVAED